MRERVNDIVSACVRACMHACVRTCAYVYDGECMVALRESVYVNAKQYCTYHRDNPGRVYSRQCTPWPSQLPSLCQPLSSPLRGASRRIVNPRRWQHRQQNGILKL